MKKIFILLTFSSYLFSQPTPRGVTTEEKIAFAYDLQRKQVIKITTSRIAEAIVESQAFLYSEKSQQMLAIELESYLLTNTGVLPENFSRFLQYTVAKAYWTEAMLVKMQEFAAAIEDALGKLNIAGSQAVGLPTVLQKDSKDVLDDLVTVSKKLKNFTYENLLANLEKFRVGDIRYVADVIPGFRFSDLYATSFTKFYAACAKTPALAGVYKSASVAVDGLVSMYTTSGKLFGTVFNRISSHLLIVMDASAIVLRVGTGVVWKILGAISLPLLIKDTLSIKNQADNFCQELHSQVLRVRSESVKESSETNWVSFLSTPYWKAAQDYHMHEAMQENLNYLNTLHKMQHPGGISSRKLPNFLS
jgi:hypothetical protein